MKKLVLLLTMGSISLSMHAQENRSSVVFNNAGKEQSAAYSQPLPDKYKVGLQSKTTTHDRVGNKTTTAPTSRWYNYAQYLDTSIAASTGTPVSLAVVTIWNDTMGQLVYTGTGLAHNRMVSCGSLFQPQAPGFNDPSLYPGEMMLTNQSFSIDSLNIFGLLDFNPAKTSEVDTLVITLTQGSVTVPGDDIIYSNFTDAATLANYGVSDSVEYGLIKYDSVTNTATGTTKYTFTYLFHSSDWADTFANGIYHKTIPLPVAYAVAANMQVGIVMTFKSGDPSFIPHDTLTGGQYNLFRPLYNFLGTSATPAFAPYSHSDYNSGQFKSLPNYRNGWENVYIPMYAWTSGSGASTLQHNNMDIHVVCTSCNAAVNVDNTTSAIKGISAYPNPASSEVNIRFDLAALSDVTVNLTNALGQLIATQQINDKTNGVATFNTAKLPAGVYLYTVTANGQRTTGRVVIAH